MKTKLKFRSIWDLLTEYIPRMIIGLISFGLLAEKLPTKKYDILLLIIGILIWLWTIRGAITTTKNET